MIYVYILAVKVVKAEMIVGDQMAAVHRWHRNLCQHL